jgi:hypothetical protein
MGVCLFKRHHLTRPPLNVNRRSKEWGVLSVVPQALTTVKRTHAEIHGCLAALELWHRPEH